MYDLIVGIVGLAILFLFSIIVVFLIRYDKWRIKFLNTKFKKIDKKPFNELLFLYKNLKLVDKIKFKYIINYSGALEEIDLGEDN